MAKRAPSDEIAYSPLDGILAQSVVKGGGRTSDGGAAPGEREGERSPEALSATPQASLAPTPGRLTLAGNSVVTRNLNREKRVLLTPEEERQVERLVDRVGEHLGTSIKLSHLLRAAIAVLCHVEAELLRRATEMQRLSRPANGDTVALAQFEQALARLLSKALRDAPPMR